MLYVRILSIAKSITENFNFMGLVRLILLLCKVEILNTLFIQNRYITIQESGMSNDTENDTENSCDWVLKGKSLWRFLLIFVIKRRK